MSGKRKLGGILSAIVTPYGADGRLNDKAIAPLVEFQLRQGVDGFYVGGSTGEAFLQSTDERAAFLRGVAEANAGRGQLIAHVGAISTSDTISLARAAADAGYDAVSAIPPFYYDFSRDELMAHYRALAGATPAPVVIYNFGGRTGKLGPDDIIRLLDDPRFAGVKHTSAELYQLDRFKRHRPDAVVFNGFDEMCLGGLAMGADGAIGTTYNFMGDLFSSIRERFLAGRMDEALALQRRANRVIDMLIRVGVFPATKGILKLMGHDCGECRPPFRNLNDGDMRIVAACLAENLPAAIGGQGRDAG